MTVIHPSAWQRIPKERCGVAVLGSTGSVGQRFVEQLHEHPWFAIRALCASAARKGQAYGAVAPWCQQSELPSSAAEIVLREWHELEVEETPLVFSALPTEIAREVEPALAQRGFFVVSNASAYRMDPRVPLVVPEVNEAHLDLIEHQDGPGALVAGPNCSTAGLVLALAPLEQTFGLDAVLVTTLQAHSGAGLPGVLGPIAEGNVLPRIQGEEEKLESEPKKIMGRLLESRIEPIDFPISATCNRVPVFDGHTECVSLRLRRAASREELLQAWAAWPGLDAPTAPEHPVVYLDDPLAPNPQTHVERFGGMSTLVGQLRPCPVLEWKFTLLSHNTLRGAAAGALLIAERWVSRSLEGA